MCVYVCVYVCIASDENFKVVGNFFKSVRTHNLDSKVF